MIEKDETPFLMSPTIRLLYLKAIEKDVEQGRLQGRAEGRLEGRLEGIRAVLKVRFGDAGTALMPRVRQLSESALSGFLDASESAADLASLIGLLPPQA